MHTLAHLEHSGTQRQKNTRTRKRDRGADLCGVDGGIDKENRAIAGDDFHWFDDELLVIKSEDRVGFAGEKIRIGLGCSERDCERWVRVGVLGTDARDASDTQTHTDTHTERENKKERHSHTLTQ